LQPPHGDCDGGSGARVFKYSISHLRTLRLSLDEGNHVKRIAVAGAEENNVREI